MTDTEQAAQVYAAMRGDVRGDSKPLPRWKDLQETERELLTRMFIQGALWMAKDLRPEDMQVSRHLSKVMHHRLAGKDAERGDLRALLVNAYALRAALNGAIANAERVFKKE